MEGKSVNSFVNDLKQYIIDNGYSEELSFPSFDGVTGYSLYIYLVEKVKIYHLGFGGIIRLSNLLVRTMFLGMIYPSYVKADPILVGGEKNLYWFRKNFGVKADLEFLMLKQNLADENGREIVVSFFDKIESKTSEFLKTSHLGDQYIDVNPEATSDDDMPYDVYSELCNYRGSKDVYSLLFNFFEMGASIYQQWLDKKSFRFMNVENLYPSSIIFSYYLGL